MKKILMLIAPVLLIAGGQSERLAQTTAARPARAPIDVERYRHEIQELQREIDANVRELARHLGLDPEDEDEEGSEIADRGEDR